MLLLRLSSLLCCLAFLHASVPAACAAPPDPARFASDIQSFEAADRELFPSTNVTLFVGSSSFRLWTNLAEAFPQRNVINRGFGGSHFSDVLYYFDRIVAPYEPKFILVYEGDNDLASGKSVDEVFTDWETFVTRVEAQLPKARIGFVAVKPSPARRKDLDAQRKLNQRIRDYCRESERCVFIDIVTPMLNEAGEPKPTLFVEDNLHMNPAGYAIWQEAVTAALARWDR